MTNHGGNIYVYMCIGNGEGKVFSGAFILK